VILIVDYSDTLSGLSVPDDPAKAHSAHEGLAWHLLVENQDEGELEDGRRKRRMM
jgi:hypothetical protein